MARLGTCYTVRPGKADKRPGISNHVRRCAVGSSSSFPGGGAGRLPRRELKNNRRGVHSSSRYGKVVGASRERIHLDVDKIDSQQFVNYFRSAAPFIEGHRGKTFVVTLPSEVVVNDRTFFGILEDILVLTGLGVRIVIVYGCTSILSAKLEERGLEPIFVGGYRVTDKQSMQVAMEVAGRIQLEIEAKLSRGPSVSVVRKHTRDNSEFRYAPPVEVVAGNYTTAKRRGVVNGVDFGYTGEVRFIQHTAILKQLDAGHIVVMSNIGFSGIGEVLNCNMHDVASHVAIEIKADKLICMTAKDRGRQNLGEWMSLPAAEKMLMEYEDNIMSKNSKPSKLRLSQEICEMSSGQEVSCLSDESDPMKQVNASWSWDLDSWQGRGVEMELVACIAACKNGVKRAHLVDARVDGGLLLELYSRDGIGTMISTDFYEGIRPASPRDVEGISSLLQPLVEKGVFVARTREQLLRDIDNFTVVERESKILACVCLLDLGTNSNGESCAELAAFCVDEMYRNGGRGDSLLDYVEQVARSKQFDTLVILTTRTADWFCVRGFELEGVAHCCDVLPENRRMQIDSARKSQCYSKKLLPIPYKGMAPAGKRIGF